MENRIKLHRMGDESVHVYITRKMLNCSMLLKTLVNLDAADDEELEEISLPLEDATQYDLDRISEWMNYHTSSSKEEDSFPRIPEPLPDNFRIESFVSKWDLEFIESLREKEETKENLKGWKRYFAFLRFCNYLDVGQLVTWLTVYLFLETGKAHNRGDRDYFGKGIITIEEERQLRKQNKWLCRVPLDE